MVRYATDTEYLLTRKTAEEYRNKGYEVLFEAPLDLLPGFRADLLARKGDEVRVIVVKSRSSLAADPRIGELARLIDSKPGWSFELVLVSEPEKLDSPEGARSFEGEKSSIGSRKPKRLSKRDCQRLPSCWHGLPPKLSSGGCLLHREYPALALPRRVTCSTEGFFMG